MPFQKGVVTNPNGRPKGKLNRTTAEAKELLEQILYGQIENIDESLANIRDKSDKDYIDACVKMFKYVIPEKKDITSDGKSMTEVKIMVDSSTTEAELKQLLNGTPD